MSLFARTTRVARSSVTRQARKMSSDAAEGPPLPNLFPAETWPLLVCIAGGVGLCVYIQARYTFSSPDIRWNKTARLDSLREEHQAKYGEAFGTHQEAIARKTGNNVFFRNAKIPDFRTGHKIGEFEEIKMKDLQQALALADDDDA